MFCVDLVVDQPQTRASGIVRQDRRNGPSITYKITPCWVTFLRPARRAAVLASPLAFVLIGLGSILRGFLDVIGKSLKSSSCYSQSPLRQILLPLPLSISGLKLVCNVNIVYGNLKSERLCPETSTKLYVHEFGFKSLKEKGSGQ